MVTHQMEEVERLCDRIILLRNGVSRAYGTVEEVQDEFGNMVIHIEHKGKIPPSEKYKVIEDGASSAKLEVTTGADSAGILRDLMDAGLSISRFTPARKSLDDIFIEIYGKEDLKDAG